MIEIYRYTTEALAKTLAWLKSYAAGLDGLDEYPLGSIQDTTDPAFKRWADEFLDGGYAGWLARFRRGGIVPHLIGRKRVDEALRSDPETEAWAGDPRLYEVAALTEWAAGMAEALDLAPVAAGDGWRRDREFGYVPEWVDGAVEAWSREIVKTVQDPFAPSPSPIRGFLFLPGSGYGTVLSRHSDGDPPPSRAAWSEWLWSRHDLVAPGYTAPVLREEPESAATIEFGDDSVTLHPGVSPAEILGRLQEILEHLAAAR